MKRFLALFLAVLMLSLSLVACGGKTGEDTTTPAVTTNGSAGGDTDVVTDPPVTTIYPDIPEDANYDDYDFVVFVAVGDAAGYKDFEPENDGYDIVNEAAFERNSAVEEALGIVITPHHENGSTFKTGPGATVMKADYTAAESNYDLMSIGAWQGPVIAQNKYGVDLYEVPYINLKQAWWDQRANTDLSLGGKMYFTTGEIGLRDNLATHCLLFSKTVAEEKGINDIYDLVLNRKWTWDKFEEYTHMVSEDLNGDDVMDISDKFGLLCWNDAFQCSFGAARTGIGMVNEEGQLELTLYSERNADLANRICNLMFDKRYSLNHINQTGISSDDIISTMFPNGQALFLTTLFLRVPLLRDSEMDFGIIPMPMYDETQGEYGGYVGPTYSTVWAIEHFVEDLERTGVVTELLAYESMQKVTPAYYEHTLKGRDARDEESIQCLEIIFANRSYDVGILYAVGGYTGSLTTMMKNGVNQFQQIYNAGKRGAEINIKQINKKFVDTNK